MEERVFGLFPMATGLGIPSVSQIVFQMFVG